MKTNRERAEEFMIPVEFKGEGGHEAVLSFDRSFRRDIEKALNEAEKRGMMRAAKIAEKEIDDACLDCGCADRARESIEKWVREPSRIVFGGINEKLETT